MGRDVDRDHEFGAHLARVMDRDRRREAAVDVLARADLDRLEHRRHRARRAHRRAGVAAAKENSFAAVEVGRGDAERDPHLLDVASVGLVADETRQRLAADQAAAGIRPVGEGGLVHRVGDGREVAPVLARREQRGDQATRRRADDQVGRETVLLERLDDADMGEATRRPAAERQADARPTRAAATTGGGNAADAADAGLRRRCRARDSRLGRAGASRQRQGPEAAAGCEQAAQQGSPIGRDGRIAAPGRRYFLMPHSEYTPDEYVVRAV